MQADFDGAIAKSSRSVGRESLEKLEKWMADFGAT